MNELIRQIPGDFALWSAMGKNAFTVAILRYVLMAVPAFVLFYLLLSRVLANRKIQCGKPKTRQLAREFGLSVSSCIIFAAIDVLVIVGAAAGMMRIKVFEPSPEAPLFVASVVGLLLVHDGYFYWSHRFMHWAPAYRLTHSTHHRSISPTPFAAFAFHPLEAVIQYAYVPVVAFLVPIHVMPLYVFGLIMTAMNVYAHLGFELMPAGFPKNVVGRYLLTPTHHDLHHSSARYDFAFYFNVWDRLMGTLNPAYEDEVARPSTRT